jgi:hypothetical protein
MRDEGVVTDGDAFRGDLKTGLITSGPGSGERDIDVVLVTGAGASRAFGVNGEPMPLMGDWSDHLVRKLCQRIGYLEATGLRRSMSGEEFEARLGKFVQDVEAFRRIGDLLDASVRFQDFGAGTQTMTAQGVMEQWHKQAIHHLGEITGLIHESLYELFADASVDLDAAAHAYQGLFHSLGLGGPDSRLVYATTNYDTVGEHAIMRSGGFPDWGQPPSLQRGGEMRLVISGLLAGLPRYIPVLHLHGRVGWFRRTDGTTYAADVVRYQADLGVPVVMLPDPEKVYDQDDIVIAMWREFSEALARAKRVFVLGHSLNDRYLLRALAQNVQPLDRIAVSVLADEHEPTQPDQSAAPVIAKITQVLGNAAMVPMRFGASADEGSVGLRTWTEKLAGNGWI